jgi:cyanophycinase
VSAGPLLLAGSGEFTTAMRDVDRALLDRLGRRPRVAIVPTAAGQEDTPPVWARLGCEHFAALGAEPVAIMVLDRAGAHDTKWIEAIARAHWIYFSGGDPGYLVETLRGTPFWQAVLTRHRAGAILAGSSAGAMMLGDDLRAERARAGRLATPGHDAAWSRAPSARDRRAALRHDPRGTGRAVGLARAGRSLSPGHRRGHRDRA